MNKDIISVIVTAYNIENFIEPCINSIINQTYTNLEIIIVNDASTDNTAQIINNLQDNDNRIIIKNKQNNEGVFKARLDGFYLSSGRYILFIDGDDELSSQMIEILYKNALNYNADISHCGCARCYSNNVIETTNNTKKIIQQDNKKGLTDLLSGDFIEPSLCNKLYKRWLIENNIENLKKYSYLKINEDYLINYFLFKNSNLSVFYDADLYFYKIRHDSASQVYISENKMKDPISVVEILYHLTLNNINLNTIIKNRAIRILIFNSTIHLTEKNSYVIKYQKKSISILRKNLLKILFSKSYTIKTKTLTIIASLSPKLYRLIYRIMKLF